MTTPTTSEVLVITRIKGDTRKFRDSLTARYDDYERWMERARQSGAKHHRFGIDETSGKGGPAVVICDVWESREQYNRFMADSDLQQFIESVGGSLAETPEVMIVEAVNSPDQF